MSNRKKEYIYVLILFSLHIILFFIAQVYYNVNTMHFDSRMYWELGQEYNWNVENLSTAFRGYLLPFLFCVAYKFGLFFGSEFLGYRILSSMTFALLHSYIYYRLYKMAFTQSNDDVVDRKIIISGGITGLLSFIFFRGIYLYSLSDAYAMVLFFLAVIMVYDLVSIDDTTLFKRVVKGILCGFFLYGSYNIRTIYLIPGIIVLIVLFLFIIKRRLITWCINDLSTVVGIILGAIPMMRLNKLLNGCYSIFVPAEGLNLFQLCVGLKVERYATYIGDLEVYKSNGMHFINRVGRGLFQIEGIDDIWEYSQLIDLFCKHPLDIIGIYVRHFLNILYPVYPDQYIDSIHKDKTILLVMAYSVLFIAAIWLLKYFSPNKKTWWLLLLLLPCLLIVPGAVEIRFFYALYFILFMIVVNGYKDVFQWAKGNKIRALCIYCIGLLIYIAYCGMLLSTTEDGMAFIN